MGPATERLPAPSPGPGNRGQSPLAARGACPEVPATGFFLAPPLCFLFAWTGLLAVGLWGLPPWGCLQLGPACDRTHRCTASPVAQGAPGQEICSFVGFVLPPSKMWFSSFFIQQAKSTSQGRGGSSTLPPSPVCASQGTRQPRRCGYLELGGSWPELGPRAGVGPALALTVHRPGRVAWHHPEQGAGRATPTGQGHEGRSPCPVSQEGPGLSAAPGGRRESVSLLPRPRQTHPTSFQGHKSIWGCF